MDNVEGTFPFGQPLRCVVQTELSPKRVFVLGVYASAVHARWVGPDDKELIKALAVASEPYIFWRGDHADEIIGSIKVPERAGRLEPASDMFNGPSGVTLDKHILTPLGLSRDDAWLCDMVPHTCRNPKQKDALEREYEPRAAALNLPTVTLPDVPHSFADEHRRKEILDEVKQAQPEVIVLLGDEPIRHWLTYFDRRRSRLFDFGEYGRLHIVSIEGRDYKVLPLAHPRQIGALGQHSPEWTERHAQWEKSDAPGLLGSATSKVKSSI